MEIKLPKRTGVQFADLFSAEFERLGSIIAIIVNLKLDKSTEDLLVHSLSTLLGDTAFKSYNIAVEDVGKGLNEAMKNVKEEELTQLKND